MTDQHLRLLARSYAYGLAPHLWTEVKQVASDRTDPALVASVLAIETGNRGRMARAIENAFAELLFALRAEGRFSRMSLGIAQLQPRRVGLGFTRASIELLNNERYAIEACRGVVVNSSVRCSLDPLAAGTWDATDWHSFGWAYNGSHMYGAVLNTTYGHVHARFGSARSAHV